MNRISKFLFLVFFSCCFASCENTYSQGKRIYTALCANCHMDDGSGLNALIPKLKGSAYLSNTKDGVVCIIKNGVRADSLGLTLKYMPAHPKMTDVELTNLLNYMSATFADGHSWKLDEVKKRRTECK